MSAWSAAGAAAGGGGARAAIPLAAGLLPGAYLATVGPKPIGVRVLVGLVVADAVALWLWAVGRFTNNATTAQRSLAQLTAPPQQPALPVFGGMASIRGRWR